MHHFDSTTGNLDVVFDIKKIAKAYSKSKHGHIKSLEWFEERFIEMVNVQIEYLHSKPRSNNKHSGTDSQTFSIFERFDYYRDLPDIPAKPIHHPMQRTTSFKAQNFDNDRRFYSLIRLSREFVDFIRDDINVMGTETAVQNLHKIKDGPLHAAACFVLTHKSGNRHTLCQVLNTIFPEHIKMSSTNLRKVKSRLKAKAIAEKGLLEELGVTYIEDQQMFVRLEEFSSDDSKKKFITASGKSSYFQKKYLPNSKTTKTADKKNDKKGEA
ncbi:hypothetical protein [Hydrogenovibrio halophilus]|uniref:hypothetical protein n=1 Tax=Hydrogenovibrio halophilus TaxID=373391 RepID=UPI0012FD3281|nr:hypothetical protein [Hydrogenovibrio halophilus]